MTAKHASKHSTMVDYQYAGDFTRCPTGPFTAANKRLVWADPLAPIAWDPDPEGKHFEIVDDDRFPGGRACRMFYPEGECGMGNQTYQLRVKSPRTVANLEWLWLFEDGFSFANDPAASAGGGKIGPCINWGEVGGVTEKRGTRAMWWWNCSGSNYKAPCFAPSCQDQRTGTQLQKPTYTAPIVHEQIYKMRLQIQGGPDGFAKYWQDDVLIYEVPRPTFMQVSPDDDVIYDFAFFSGGADARYTPAYHSYARHGGVRYWSGETYWEGNGDEGSGGGGGTGPTPPAGGFTVTIDGVDYQVTGNWTLTAL